MKLGVVKRKKNTHYYITESYREGDKVATRTVKKLGTDKEICEKYGVDDARAWAKEQVDFANSLSSNNTGKHVKFRGIKMIRSLCKKLGLIDFFAQIEKETGTKKNEIVNTFLLLVVNELYYPRSHYIYVPYLTEGYFKYKPFSFTHFDTVFKILVEKNDEIISTISKHNKYAKFSDVAFLASIELVNLPKEMKNTENQSMSILYDSNYVPLTLMHSCLSEKTNLARLKESIKNFGFVDLYTNGGTGLLEKTLPKNVSISNVVKISYEMANKLVGKDVKLTNDYEIYSFQQNKDLKKYALFNNARYKRYPILGDSTREVTVFYLNAFKTIDRMQRAEASTNLLDNAQCSVKNRNEIISFINNKAFPEDTLGYRFYVTPKNVDIKTMLEFTDAYSSLTPSINSKSYEELQMYLDMDDKDAMLATQTLNYISHLIEKIFLMKSNNTISSYEELSLFFNILDGTGFYEQLSSGINQIMYRLKYES